MYQLQLNFEQILRLVKQLPIEDKLKLRQEIEKDTQQIINKWEYLRKNHQELDPLNPLSNEEIDIICEYLKQENKPRPTIETQTKINVPDNFNEPLPADNLIIMTEDNAILTYPNISIFSVTNNS